LIKEHTIIDAVNPFRGVQKEIKLWEQREEWKNTADGSSFVKREEGEQGIGIQGEKLNSLDPQCIKIGLSR